MKTEHQLTKEEILNKFFWVAKPDLEKVPESYVMIGSRIHGDVLLAMQEYSDLQNTQLKEQLTAKEKDIERYKKIVSQPDWNELEYVVGLETKLSAKEKELNKTKLEILEQVKFSFDVQSDYSSNCNGYKALCREIESINTPK